jgi:hypothetical protein
MGEATDTGSWTIVSMATLAAQETGEEIDPAERPTRRDLPRLQPRDCLSPDPDPPAPGG